MDGCVFFTIRAALDVRLGNTGERIAILRI